MKMVTVHNNNHAVSFRTKSIELFDRLLRRDGGLLILLTLLAMPLLFSQLFLSDNGSNRALTESPAMMNVAEVNSHINMTALLESNPVDNIRPYDLDDLLRVIPYYDHAMALLIYDPIDDRFFAYYSTNHIDGSAVDCIDENDRRTVFKICPRQDAPNPTILLTLSLSTLYNFRHMLYSFVCRLE
mmetsp:Transcript_23869/g.47349  ORF Transcript_23869/g.47349 Transcript_23869/m.47349 type:complete len:185 (+) Transcript_23869:242-796(+)